MERTAFTVSVSNGSTATVEAGSLLLGALQRAGADLAADCGGNGLCGKCTVKVRAANSPSIETETVLACTYHVEEDVFVELPAKTGGDQIVETGMGRHVPLKPFARVIRIEREKAALGAYKAEARLVCENLSRADGCGQLHMGIDAVRELATHVAQDAKTLWALVIGDEVVRIWDAPRRPYVVACDIGTTTVVGYLLDGETGEQLAVASMLNPQGPYGQDVVSRATFAVKEDPETLTELIRGGLDQLIGTLVADARITRDDVVAVACAGNTCMIHLLLGIAPSSLLQVPYNATIDQPIMLPANDLGLEIVPGGRAQTLPILAGFVGADTDACLIDVDFAQIKQKTLLIDIGTNGELVMGTGETALATSTAAGPALEGARISCGMRGAAGAIDHVRVADDGSLEVSVIGGGQATGICGSGVIDLVALLVHEGIVDKRGRFHRPDRLEGAFAVAHADRLACEDGSWGFTVSDGVTLTQRDIREVQLAKSAIAAGIQILSRKLGWSVDEIEQVFIAGAFGTYMDPRSACEIGLLPAQLLDRIKPVGNAAGEGVKIALLNRDEFETGCHLARSVPFVELATEDDFQHLFVAHLNF